MTGARKRLIIIMLAAAALFIAALGLFGCTAGGKGGGSVTPAHEHTFSDEWSYDDADHWHAATCGCDDVKDKAAHDLDDFAPSEYSLLQHVRKCKVCGYVQTGAHEYGDPDITRATSCAEYDIYKYTCTVCGYEKTEQYRGSIPHSWGDWIAEDGMHIRTCSVCESKQTHGAALDKGAVTKSAKCEETGEREYKCALCTYVYIETIPALWHEWNAFVPADDEGHTHTCRRCYVREKLPHGLSAWTADDGAVHSRGCETCGYTASGDHAFAGNTCSVCDFERVYADDLLFSPIEEGGEVVAYAVAGKGSFTGTELFVPAEHEGKPVTKIGDSAFASSSIVTVVLPDTVTDIAQRAFYSCGGLKHAHLGGAQAIGEAAFYNCRALDDLRLGESLVTLGLGAFKSCSSLTQIDLPAGVTAIPQDAFYGCTKLSAVGYPAGLLTIGPAAFFECKALTEAILPDGLMSLGDRAYAGCVTLRKAYVPASLTSALGVNVFNGCTALSELTIPYIVQSYADPAYNTTVLGRLFGTISNYNSTIYTSVSQYVRKTQTTVFHVPLSLRKLTILGGYIPYGGVMNFRMVTDLVLGDGVAGADAHAFEGCNALRNVTVGSGITSFGTDAFKSVGTPQRVSYTGSAEDWAQIEFGNAAANPMSAAKGVVYIDDDAISGDLTFVSLTKVGAYAFYSCKGLTSITLPSGAQQIGEGAFSGCKQLTSISLGGAITQIGEGAFAGCTALAFASYSGSLADWCEVELCDAMSNPAYYAGGMTIGGADVCGAIDLTAAPSIGDYSFYNFGRVTGVTTGDNVTDIGVKAFYGMATLASVEIGESVATIGGGAFASCPLLTDVTWNAIAVTSAGGADSLIFGTGAMLSDLTLSEGVTAIPAYAFKSCSHIMDVTFPSTLLTVGDSAFYGTHIGEIALPHGLTTVGASAFENCTQATRIYIPNTVRNINADAFAGCANAAAVEWEDCNTSASLNVGARAFKGLSRITEMSFPYYTHTIGESALSGCGSLSELAVPFCGSSYIANVASESTLLGYIFGKESYTGGMAIKQFYNASGAQATANRITFYIPSSLRSITFNGTTSYRHILYGAMSGCSMLTDVSISHYYTYLESHILSGCSGLVNIKIPFTGYKESPDSGAAGVNTCFGYIFGTTKYNVTDPTMQRYSVTYDAAHNTYINRGSESFYIPGSIRTVDMSENSSWSVRIYGGAFYGCANIESIILPERTVSIGDCAFYGCAALQGVAVPDTVTEIGLGAFEGCAALETATLSSDLESLGMRAFSGCSSLQAIEIPKNVPTIDISAFSGCSSLSSVAFEANSVLSAINAYAFSGAAALTEIELPASLESIGNRAFYNTNLASMTFGNTSGWKYSDYATMVQATNISSYDFSDPVRAATKYMSTYWSKYLKRS